jgi:hypothetical protein
MYKKNRTKLQKKRKNPSPARTFNEERGFLFFMGYEPQIHHKEHLNKDVATYMKILF